MTAPTDIERALAVAQETAAEAAEIAFEGFRTGVQVRKKGAIDLLTEYDLRAESHIRQRLSKAFPQHRIVGEEGDNQGEGELVWYVDPIDGTTNFAHGHPFFAVSVALYNGDEGLVGVVVAPALDIAWSAMRGGGALRNGTPCQVTHCKKLDDALCATGFPYDRRTATDDNVEEFRAFLKRAQGVSRCGSAAIDLAMVADGTFDVYWEQRLQAWDMCAGALLVTEAGGRLSAYDGSVGDPRTGALVATNGHLHDEALAVLAEVRAR